MISPSYIHANTASQLLSQALSPLSPNTRRNTHTSNRFFSCLRFFKALLPAAEILPRSPQVWWVNLVPPRPTFHLQKGSETAVPREGGPGGQGNLSEEGGEMQWLLHGFEEPDKGVWTLALSLSRGQQGSWLQNSIEMLFPSQILPELSRCFTQKRTFPSSVPNGVLRFGPSWMAIHEQTEWALWDIFHLNFCQYTEKIVTVTLKSYNNKKKKISKTACSALLI